MNRLLERTGWGEERYMAPVKGLSRDARSFLGQPMFKLLARVNELEAQGREILHFEIGEPNYPSPAPVVESCCKALKEGRTHYVNSMGINELREKIQDITEKELGFRPTMKQVLVTPANAIIYFLIRCVANPGEGVIYPDPGFPSYYAAAICNRTKPVPVPVVEAQSFTMDAEEIASRLEPKTRLIIINSPGNPTGAVMTEEQVQAIFELADRHGIYLLSDETYDKIIYEGKHFSPAVFDRCRETTVLLKSFSKAYAMTGWRLGYAVGPEPVIEKMGLLLQTIVSCVPPFIQYAGITALEEGHEFNHWMVDELRQRRNQIVAGLRSLEGVSCLEPKGAFYVFPNISWNTRHLNSEQFADLMLEKAGIALLPGTNFGQYGEGYVRLSYATSQEFIDKAIARMRGVF